MAFDESHHRAKPRTQFDELADAEKRRKIDEYRRPFLEAIRRCPCHCHLETEGVQCKCIKNCEHCRRGANSD